MPAVSRATALASRLAAPGVVLVLLAGCTGGAPVDSTAPPPAPEPTPLAALDTSGVVVPRADHCDDVAAQAVVEALGSPAVATERWADGEPARLEPGLRDVAHEWGCAWRAADGGAARTWVFAPPLTPARARRVARSLARDPGCTALPDAPAFGSPTAATLCRDRQRVEAGFAGLFGDAWLSCSVAAPRAEADTEVARDALVARAGVWCAQVLAAARA